MAGITVEDDHKADAPAEAPAAPAAPAAPKTINLDTASEEELNEVVKQRAELYGKLREDLEKKAVSLREANKKAGEAVRQCVGGEPNTAAKAFHAQTDVVEAQAELISNLNNQVGALVDILRVYEFSNKKAADAAKQAAE